MAPVTHAFLSLLLSKSFPEPFFRNIIYCFLVFVRRYDTFSHTCILLLLVLSSRSDSRAFKASTLNLSISERTSSFHSSSSFIIVPFLFFFFFSTSSGISMLEVSSATYVRIVGKSFQTLTSARLSRQVAFGEFLLLQMFITASSRLPCCVAILIRRYF